jgi:hypothetical protein
MELQISLPENAPRQGVLNLKEFLDRAGIDGVERTKIDTAPLEEGEMGVGELLNSITAIISAAAEPLVELVRCLHKYAENYRTRLTITANNVTINIEHGKSMKTEQLKELMKDLVVSMKPDNT